MARRVSRTPARLLASWRWGVLGGMAFVLLLIGFFWWSMSSQSTRSGTPQLVVDRTEVDLGTLRYNAPALAVFTLTNIGNGVLKIFEEPIVKAVKGC